MCGVRALMVSWPDRKRLALNRGKIESSCLRPNLRFCRLNNRDLHLKTGNSPAHGVATLRNSFFSASECARWYGCSLGLCLGVSLLSPHARREKEIVRTRSQANSGKPEGGVGRGGWRPMQRRDAVYARVSWVLSVAGVGEQQRLKLDKHCREQVKLITATPSTR